MIDTSTTAQRLSARWARWRWPVLVGAVVVGVVLLVALWAPTTTAGDLDPQSSAPGGSRAVAQILQAQGVRVTRVTRSTDLVWAAAFDNTVVVVHPQLLGPDQLDRLAATSARLVLIEPDAPVLAAVAPFAQVAGTVPARDQQPQCDDPAAAAAGRVRSGGHLYRSRMIVTSCYPQPGEPGVAGMIRGRSEGRDVTVLGQADVLRNGHLAEQGDAALSLRLLGARPTLVWYLPDPLELSDGTSAPSLSSLLPDWVGWVTAQVLIALVLAVFWRARRLGPLVTEPLPVVVRAAETQEGRARLYRQAGARGRAAATLRTATARRLATRLDVPPDADPSTVAVLAAQVVGQPPEQVAETLLGHAPDDDAALVALADRLDALERAVAGTRVATGRRTGGPVGSSPAAGPAAGSPAAGTHPSTNGRSGTGRPDREAPPR